MDPKKVKNVLSKNILADGFSPIIDLDNSHESWLVDARNGDKYLDMFSMYASGSIGYNHPEILNNKDLLTKASLFKPTLSDIFPLRHACIFFFVNLQITKVTLGKITILIIFPKF